MAAKRKAKESKKDISHFNVWWQLSAYAMGLLVAIGVSVFAWQQLTRPDVLPIKELRVTGEFSQVSAEDLRSIVETRIDGNFFMVDVDRIHRAIDELPWVNFVWVDRIWPNVLQVRVLEQKPVGVWNGKYLINEYAVVFAEYETQFDALPKLNGPDGMQDQVMSMFQDISSNLKKHGLVLNVLNMDKRKAMSAELDGGLSILMGRDDVRYRLDRFLKIYSARLANEESDIKQVDLRYSNGFALTRGDDKGSANYRGSVTKTV